MARYSSPDVRNPGRPPRPIGSPRTALEPSARSHALRDELQKLYELRPTRAEFARESASRIAGSMGTTAIALLGYEERNDRMLLLADQGLSPDARRLLGAETGRLAWDIPLRALRNRRINVIESAHKNPFVPKPFVALSPRQLSIGVLPFYHAAAPEGVLVLFSARALTDSMLQNASQALRVCAAAFAELPHDAAPGQETGARPKAGEQAPLLRGVTTLKAELQRLARALQEAERKHASEAAERITAESFLKAEREKVSRLEEEMAALRREKERLGPLEKEVETLRGQARDTSGQMEETRARVGELETALEEARREMQEAHERAREEASTVESLTVARDELREQLDRSEEAAREQASARASLEERVAELKRQNERLSETERALAGAERDREELQSALDEAHARAAARDREREEALAERTQAEAEADALRKALEEVRAERDAARGRVGELEEAVLDAEAIRQRLGESDAQRDELERRAAELEQATTERQRQWEKERDERQSQRVAIERERDQLAAQLETQRAEAEETAGRLRARLEASEEDRRGLSERLEALVQADSERQRLQGRLENESRELGTLRGEVERLEARVGELGETNERLINERRELHDRVEELVRGGQTLEQEKQAQINAANAAQARVTELESALSRLAKELSATRSQGSEEVSRLHERIEELEGKRVALEREQERAQAAVREREQQATELSATCQRLREEAERRAHEQRQHEERAEKMSEENAELARVRDRHAERVEALERELEAAEAARQRTAEDLRLTRERLAAEAAERTKKAEESRRELERSLREEREGRADQVRGLEERIGELRARMTAQIEEMTQRHQQAEERFRAEEEGLRGMLSEKEELLRDLEERLALGELRSEPISFADVEEEAELEIDRVAEAQAGEAAPAPLLAQAPREFFLLDSTEVVRPALAHLSASGFEATGVDTGDAGSKAVSALRERRVASLAVNLASPRAWESLRQMGNEPLSLGVPSRAYALAPEAKAGFWFGPVAFQVLPVPDGLVEVVTRLVPRIRRLLAMSTDLDVMTTVRGQLNGARISTAVVLDGRQTVDLIPTVRPEAAVLHLSPSCSDVFRAIAGLRSSEIARDIPLLFLLDDKPEAREEAFLNAGIRMLSGRGNLKAEDLPAVLAEAFEPARPQPEEGVEEVRAEA